MKYAGMPFGMWVLFAGSFEGGDDGAPAATKVDSVTGQAFLSLAQSIVTVVNRRNAEKAPTKIVSTH